MKLFDKNKIIRLFVSLIFLLSFTENSYAQPSKFEKIEILKEDTRVYSYRELITQQVSFENYISDGGSQVKVKFWLRFKYSKSDPSKNFYLFRPFILDQQLDLFYKIGDSLYHYVSGLGLPLKDRELFFPNHYLPLPNIDKPTICYLHVQSFYSYSFFFAEADTKTISREEYSRASIEYFYIGVGFLSIVFSLLFFAYLKERLYLYYSLFTTMLLLLRLTYNGIIYNYLHSFYDVSNFNLILNLYEIGYGGMNIAILLYFHDYFRFRSRSKAYHYVFYGLVVFRLMLLVVNDHLPQSFNVYTDLTLQCLLLIFAIRTAKYYFKPCIIAAISLAILIIGNLSSLLPNIPFLPISSDYDYYFYLNLAGLEVVVFGIGMAYRNNFLKELHNDALEREIYVLKESKQLKENINKELEKQVADRTQQIQKMNEMLQLHNIKLSSEVKTVNEARAFQRKMNFADFQLIFPDDASCYKYLAQLKWKPNSVIKCRKCNYDNQAIISDFSIRCRRCNYAESATFGTLFQRLKFPMVKAFYITYATSTSQNDVDVTIAQLSQEIDLRSATVWAFKQKVLTLMHANKARKKHKDGWTHLIEYSIIR